MALQLRPAPRPDVDTEAPPEVWMHIAQFIPHADLCSMLSVNRLFFQLSMDARYHGITLALGSDVQALRRMSHRVRDPSITHRVRHVHIKLSFFKELINQMELEGRSLSDIVAVAFCVPERTQIITETVTSLANVTELSVEWGDSSPKKYLTPLFVVVWKSLGPGLRKLSFEVSLKNLITLLSTADGLVSLIDLDVKVVCDESDDAADKVLAAALAPFVNKVAPSLRGFSFSSASLDLDPSLLFHRLENISSLERLCIEHHAKTITEPLSITRFVFNHATTLCHLYLNEGDAHSDEQRLMAFGNENLFGQLFSKLCTLQIQVPMSCGGSSNSKVMEHIMFSSTTLTSLGLFDYMNNKETNTLLSLFAPRWDGHLKELSFQVESLAAELILLLAQMLPRLEKLAIRAIYLTGYGVRQPTPINVDRAKREEHRKQMERLYTGVFRDTMRTYDFEGWAIRDIHIHINLSSDEDLSLKVMQVLRECVPSLQNFEGKTSSPM